MRHWRNMSTPKAKLHQLYFNTDKKCHYETQQLGGSGIGLLVGPDGLLEVGQSKVEQLFVCTLHLPDGSTVQSGNFRRKKDAEQDAASLTLQKVFHLTECSLGYAYSPRDCPLYFLVIIPWVLFRLSLSFKSYLQYETFAAFNNGVCGRTYFFIYFSP